QPEYVRDSKANVFTLAKFAAGVIQNLREDGINFIVIDALRNLHEINYLRAEFSNFYLFSLNASPGVREKRLMLNFGYKKGQLESIQKMEMDKSNLHSQNINMCIGNGDVFISNDAEEYDLYYSLMKYVSLVL